MASLRLASLRLAKDHVQVGTRARYCLKLKQLSVCSKHAISKWVYFLKVITLNALHIANLQSVLHLGYLRVSKYTVLETRIYLDNPTLWASWFLNPRDLILPKVIEAVRGMVLPKLREATASGGAKSKKKRAVKDVVTGGRFKIPHMVRPPYVFADYSMHTDGFEVVVFLTEGGTRHTVLSKTRLFHTPKPRIKSNTSKYLNRAETEDVDICAESEEYGASTQLHNIPLDTEVGAEDDAPEEQDPILVESSDGEGDGAKDEKKPLSRTTYDGFTIYSRVLCLVVKKLDTSSRGADSTTGSTANTGVPLPGIDTYAERPRADSGRGMMEDWITMTQIAGQNQDAGNI